MASPDRPGRPNLTTPDDRALFGGRRWLTWWPVGVGGSDGEPFSAPGLSSFDDIPAIRRAHSREESVGPFSLAFVGLICPLHARSSFGRYGPFRFIGAGKARWSIAVRAHAVKPQMVVRAGRGETALHFLWLWLKIVRNLLKLNIIAVFHRCGKDVRKWIAAPIRGPLWIACRFLWVLQ